MGSSVLSFVSRIITPGIILFGVAILVLLLMNAIQLANRKARIDEALHLKNYKYRFDAERKEIEENEDTDAAITPDTIRKYETEFNQSCSGHDLLAQLIPIFPLLGILGTVAGLMGMSMEDMAAFNASFGTALSSTFAGLIFSIVLKVADAFITTRIIAEVEVMLEDFEKKMDLAEMFRNLEK